jgi:hypothetical protein
MTREQTWSGSSPTTSGYTPARRSSGGAGCSIPPSSDDGSITTRGLDEFVERQRNYFATGRKISERLENVRIDLGRRIARVSADFVFVDNGEQRPGTLGLHLAEGQDGWRIVAVLFSYDAP